MNYEDCLAYWQSHAIDTSAELEAILNRQITNFAYHSGKINIAIIIRTGDNSYG